MIGTTKMILNDETIAEALKMHFNEHVFKDAICVSRVEKEYVGQIPQWVAYFEPVNAPATQEAKP